MSTTDSLRYILPELVLTATILVLFVGDLLVREKDRLAALATVWMSLGSKEVQRTSQGEYYGLLLSSTLGMYFMASASNLIMAYLALEFVSLTSYVLTGYLRHDRRSGAAALKYLIYGGVASGTMIYGMSWIFGLAGSLDFAQINTALTQGDPNKLALFIALVLTLTGLGYK